MMHGQKNIKLFKVQVSECSGSYKDFELNFIMRF